MLKKVPVILTVISAFFVMYIAYGMEEQHPVTHAGLYEVIPDMEDLVSDEEVCFKGESTIYYSPSSSEEEVDKQLKQFHIIEKENFDMIEAVLNRPIELIDDYHDASNIEKPSDLQEATCEQINSFDRYYSLSHEQLLGVGAYANDFKKRLLKALDQQQPR